jgi:hypothetical protein
MLSELDRHALDQMTGSGLTTMPIDNARAVLVIRAATASGDREYGLRLVASKRASHRTWITVTQRQWQRHSRRPSRARHDDSIAIREQYVRCAH